MRVLLRDCQTGFYFAGPQHWVPDPWRATDLEQVERATRLEDIASIETEIVLDYPDPGLRSRYRANPEKTTAEADPDLWLTSASAGSL